MTSALDLSDIETQKRLIENLAPRGVPRAILRALFGLNQNQISSRASAVGISFREFMPVGIVETRRILREAGIEEDDIEQAVRRYYGGEPMPGQVRPRQKTRASPRPRQEQKEKKERRKKAERRKPETPLTYEQREALIQAPHTPITKPTDEEMRQAWMHELFRPPPLKKIPPCVQEKPKTMPAPLPPKPRHAGTPDPGVCQWPVPGPGIGRDFICGKSAEGGYCEGHRKKIRRFRPIFAAS